MAGASFSTDAADCRKDDYSSGVSKTSVGLPSRNDATRSRISLSVLELSLVNFAAHDRPG
jgi:hypothetical protein